jgi:predicted nucleic acid-binding protein
VALVLDTGPLVAYLDRSDRFHVECRNLIEGASEALVVPAPVLVELDYWIHARMQPSVLLAFLDEVTAGAFSVHELLPEDYGRVRYLCDRYADSDIGLVDAAVIAVVERLNEPKLATLDRRHFGLIRPRHVPALHLLP